MIDVNLNGAEPTHVDRIKPEFSIDPAGNINWLPGLIDHNAAVFHRGKTVTNEEYNTLFLKGVYQGNYTADSLKAFFKDHLNIAISRKFENMYNLQKSYTQVFSASDWGEKQEDGYYYITIPATVHGIQPLEQNTGVNRISVDTEMYVLDGEKLLEVSQVYVEIDNTVTLYTDDSSLTGFVIIRLNDKAFVSPGASISVSQIFDIADVAKTGAYVDLKGLNDIDGPNYRLTELEKTLSQITAGELTVPKANNATEATNATNITGSIRNISLNDIFESGSSVVKNATNITGSIRNIPLDDIFEPGSNVVKNTTNATNADNVTGSIRNIALDNIFEENSNVVKYASNLVPDIIYDTPIVADSTRQTFLNTIAINDGDIIEFEAQVEIETGAMYYTFVKARFNTQGHINATLYQYCLTDEQYCHSECITMSMGYNIDNMFYIALSPFCQTTYMNGKWSFSAKQVTVTIPKIYRVNQYTPV